MSGAPLPNRTTDISNLAWLPGPDRSATDVWPRGSAEPLRVRVGGLRITVLSRAEWAETLMDDWRTRRRVGLPPRLLTSANGNVLSLYASNARFRALVDRFDAVDADGMSLVFASRLQPGPALPERVATTDFVHDAARAGAPHGLRFYLLGARPDENRAAQQRLRERYPGLVVDGRDGYFSDDETNEVIEQIRLAAPDVLWIGLGVPREQAFALLARDRLPRITWIKTCGGLFDWLAEKNPRAPEALQKAGLEWAWRVWLEPRRLFKRYLVTNLHAVWLMARCALRQSQPPKPSGKVERRTGMILTLRRPRAKDRARRTAR
ncbi:WecB/TagA/CpsF family glycosyltransferase [Alsobacter sp. SYSU M60028]|uniref:WecB/TagA/CpsF family glycosyltransferase n=1 Tax=Alsobacter ponti TaxID=2962936 RepID=A0ABT1LEB4_9HYPH|nr:WecB/TagA/CpsF family glycosyltransferase [Alsobacter ponti]MCP8939774.1 WecB/TagA/CpsF family glycosyltransferase [Alsobacter ponti]